MLIFDYKDTEKYFFEEGIEDFDIKFFEDSLNEQTVENLSDEDKTETTVLSVFINSEISSDVLNKFHNLRIIATRSTGINHIDVEACNRRHIKILNVEKYGSTSVVQYTFTLILAMIRKLIPVVMDMKGLKLNFKEYIGRDLSNLTLGVVGCGAIGSSVCQIANAFSMRVLAFDTKQNKELIEKCKVEFVDLNDLLSNSDVVSLHLPYTGENYHMISKPEFEKMKKTAFIINTSRGELIDTSALYESIIDKKIAGAALDVVECEQLNFYARDFISSVKGATSKCRENALIVQKLVEMPNVIISPHIAYDTKEAIDTILKTTFLSIKDYLKGGNANQVN